MTQQFAIIYLEAGVNVRIPVEVSCKHHTEEENVVVLEHLAQKLGGTYLYLETVENQS